MFWIASNYRLVSTIGAFWYWGSPNYTDVGYQPEQPVPYSHKFHVGELAWIVDIAISESKFRQ